MKKTLLIPALLLLAAPASPQTTHAQTKNAVGSALQEALTFYQKNSIAAVEAMPADRFNYKPTINQMAFGQVFVRIVETNYLRCGQVASVSAPKIESVEATDAKDKLVATLKASFDFCADAFSKMDDSKLGETTTAGKDGQQFSRADIALGIVDNWASSHAAAWIYLRLNGILPPTDNSNSSVLTAPKPQCHELGEGVVQIEDARPGGAGHCAGESDFWFTNTSPQAIDCAIIFHKNGRFDPASVLTFTLSPGEKSGGTGKISTCGADSQEMKYECFSHAEQAAANSCIAQVQWDK